MDDPTDQDLAIQAILDVVGRKGMEALRAAKGGTEVWIPRDPDPDHWMCQVFGVEKALEIVRRLTVTDADGRSSCGIRFYVAKVKTRVQEFREQLAREIAECLLKGMGTRETALEIRVSEYTINSHKNALIAQGRLKALPPPPKRLAAPACEKAPRSEQARSHHDLWKLKRALVDEALIKGHSNKRIAVTAGVGRTYIRVRRKVLFASGQLRPGRNTLVAP